MKTKKIPGSPPPRPGQKSQMCQQSAVGEGAAEPRAQSSNPALPKTILNMIFRLSNAALPRKYKSAGLNELESIDIDHLIPTCITNGLSSFQAVEHILPDKKDRALFLSNLLTSENDQKLWKINLEAILSNPGERAKKPTFPAKKNQRLPPKKVSRQKNVSFSLVRNQFED